MSSPIKRTGGDKLRVALYCRVSSDEQAKHGLSLGDQLTDLRAWAEKNGHEVVGEYLDGGVSGKRPYLKRPKLSQFVQDLEDGLKVDALVFVKLDRFFRSVKLYYDAVTVLDKHKVAWVAIHERYETVSSQGRFVVNLMLSIAEAEADRTGERLRTTLSHKFARGEWSGKAPRGYSVVDKRLTPNEIAPIITEAFRVCHRSCSVVAAQSYLHSQGIKVVYNTAYRIMTNPIYIGVHDGVEGFCEPLIDDATFHDIQSMLGKRSDRTNDSGRIYLFSGLLVCSCGRNLVGNCNTTYSPGKQYRYRCAGCYRDHLCSNNKYLIESEIEDFLLAKVCQEIEKMSAQVEYSAPVPKPIDNTAKIERLTELYVEGEISREEYQKRKDALTVPPVIKQPTPRIKEIALSGDDLRESYQSFTRQERRAVWKSVIDRVDVDGDALTVTFRT